MLGQSNAVGHALPMKDEDMIRTPLKNVFGLQRKDNQSFDTAALTWSGYTSFGTNLAEEQDNTYSLPNCLAQLWQTRIDNGDSLPDLYIVQIAVGAEGVTDGYMWHPNKEKRLIPGPLGTVDISLFSFTNHIFRLLDNSFQEEHKDYEIIGLHWRGGENDVTATEEYLSQHLHEIYETMLRVFNTLLNTPPVILHRLVCPDRMNAMDPTGQYLRNMQFINGVFEKLAQRHENVSVFDTRTAPQYTPSVCGNGLFIEDLVHFTPEINRWVADKILKDYKDGRERNGR